MDVTERGPDSRFPAGVPRSCAALFLASSVAAFILVPASSQTAAQQVVPQQQNVTLSGHIRYSRISPPQAGVKLLDDIFSKVRSTPQLAMAKNNLNNLKQQSQELQQTQSKTDYTLAIRPRQAGKTSLAQSPTLQLVPNEISQNQSQSDANSLPVAFGGGGANAGNNGIGGMTIANAPSTAQSWQGNRQLPLMANNGQRSSGMWESPQQKSMAFGGAAAPATVAPNLPSGNFYNRSDAQSVGDAGATVKNELAKEASASNARRQYEWKASEKPPSLSVALGRLASVTRAMDQAQKLAQAPPPMAAPQSQLRDKAQAEETAYRSVDKKAASLSDLESYPIRTSARSVSPADSDGFKLKSKAKKSAGRERKPAELNDEVDALTNQHYAKDGRARIAMGGADIALLPPNVVTGIPLVRLGISQNQAHTALAAMGSMKQDKVSKWTVWSWQRPQSKIATALQLYIRNNTGLLDAMRIFDRSLIAPDFGVSLGDNLARVKEKFGEPAFILQEPVPGAGQNYIYPISQVGFQMARPSPDEQPRVVSILIFNVK